MISHYRISYVCLLVCKGKGETKKKTKERSRSIIIADTIIVIIVIMHAVMLTLPAVVYWSCRNLGEQELKQLINRDRIYVCVATISTATFSFLAVHSI